MKKVLLTTVMSLMMCMGVFAQTQPDYMKAPKLGEKVIGVVSGTSQTSGDFSDHDRYDQLLEKARQEYPNRAIDIRRIECEKKYAGNNHDGYGDIYHYSFHGKVIEIIGIEAHVKEHISQAFNKALRNVREGSRLAIDQVSVPYTMEKENLKDQLLDLLLDKGYKVIAKDYLDKLYEEQQAQQSGIYNDNTTVQDNNFSAVGYYINVKVTETSLRVQVVNVSTGEYEGNATVNF